MKALTAREVKLRSKSMIRIREARKLRSIIKNIKISIKTLEIEMSINYM